MNQWTAEPPAPLQVPPERLATQRYRFTAPAPVGLVGTCAEYAVMGGAFVRLTDVLIDTSERVHGITFKKRVTHREELVINAPIVLFPLETNLLDDPEAMGGSINERAAATT